MLRVAIVTNHPHRQENLSTPLVTTRHFRWFADSHSQHDVLTRLLNYFSLRKLSHLINLL